MRLTINGEDREIGAPGAPPLTVGALLAELGLAERRVAVEVNRRIARRADHATHALAEGDAVEIVQFVGGG